MESLAMPVIRHAARSYISGETASDAGRLARDAGQHGFACTLCYWNDGKENPETVAAQYRLAVDTILSGGLDGTLALKLPALWDRVDLAASVVSYARDRGVRALFDSHAPGQSDAIFRAIDICGPSGVGLAIPGRWTRSTADAERALALGLDVRIVKGQWADDPDTGIDVKQGYLRIVAQLAGRAPHVGVATHDAALSLAALRLLIAKSTPCEQELIYPDPTSRAIAVAAQLGVPSRLYIPFGSAWLPYSIRRASSKPQVLLWLLRDIFTSRRFKMPSRNLNPTAVTAEVHPKH
jgi:proline dehydrogenase